VAKREALRDRADGRSFGASYDDVMRSHRVAQLKSPHPLLRSRVTGKEGGPQSVLPHTPRQLADDFDDVVFEEEAVSLDDLAFEEVSASPDVDFRLAEEDVDFTYEEAAGGGAFDEACRAPVPAAAPADVGVDGPRRASGNDIIRIPRRASGAATALSLDARRGTT